jgi:hypothetical protein
MPKSASEVLFWPSKGWKPYLFLLPSRRNFSGDFHRFPSEDALLIEPANERSNSCAIISPTALNLCPTYGATDADNHVHQNEQRDLMARYSPSAILDEIMAGSVVLSPRTPLPEREVSGKHCSDIAKNHVHLRERCAN